MPNTELPKPRSRSARFGMVLVAVGLLWLALNGLDGPSWMIGLPAVAGGSYVALRIYPAAGQMIRLAGLWGFFSYFAVESLSGGVDVARRAFHRAVPLDPQIVAFAPRLPVGSARWFFCACISLLPGTCVVGIGARAIQIHLLDGGADNESRLRKLEERIAAVFGLALPDDGGTP